MKKLLMTTVFCLTSIAIIALADSSSLLKEVRQYGEKIDRIEKSAGKVSLQEIVQEGTSMADKLRPVIEELSESDYDFVLKNMKGFAIGRQEAVFIEPDTVFFSSLAKKVGIEDDRLYFHFLNEVMPDGSWPVYVEQQTDVGGCTKYGEGYLSNLYKKGNALLPKVTGYYSKGVKRIVRHLSDKLVSGTCACGDRQSVIKELRLFLELNKESDIVAKVKKRLEVVQKDRSTMEFNCIGGR